MEATTTAEPQSESESAQVMLSEPPSEVEQPAEEGVEIDTPAEEEQQHEEDSPVISDETAENTTIITEPQTDDVAETEEEETPELVETTTEEVLEDETAEELAPEVVDEATHINNNDDKRPLRVLFLSDETGGGHRASAEALGKQFMIQYPGSTVEICNLWTEAGDRVFKSIVKSYKHMSASPWQWKLFYHATNTKVVEVIGKNHSNIFCAEKVKARISEFQPDAVISVHPTMNHLARIQTRLIGKELGKHIPFYTVVTDLGSAHGTWFQREVNKIYVASNNLVQLALDRRIPPAKIVRTGLPIRHGFAVQAKALHRNRTLEESKQYIMQIRTKLGLIEKEEEEKEPANEGEAEERESASAPPKPTPMILVMGGGEGVGSLSDIVNQLYATLTLEGQDATVCVVCGRNEALKEELENRDWFAVVEGALQERIRRRNMSRTFRERIMTSAPPPPNFCSPDTILCGEDSGLLPALISANRYNSVDGPKSMEQVMAEAAMLPSPLSSSPPSDSPMNDANLTRSPLMKLITKLPGINEKKAPPPPLLTDAAPKEDDDDDDDDDEDDVGLNPPTPPTPQQAPPAIQPGRVNVVGLGFVTNMEEYMVAADVLVTKAGPGTIAEAAAVGLPVMLTSYLPGQEAGNVDVVLEAGFGDYCVDPFEISARVCSWLKDDTIIDEMSRKAHKAGHPHAADDIVADIGSETVTWMKMNQRWKGDPIYKPFIELGHTLVLDSYLHDKTEVENLARISSEHKMASTESTRRSFATAAGVGVGAAVGAVMAGPLLPVGLMVGSAVIPALPVGLVVGGGLSGLAANQLKKQEARNAAETAAAEETDEEGKEEKKEERDDEAPKSRFFGWGSSPTSPASDEVTGESAPVDATAAAKSKWFGWGSSRKSADAVGNESLAPETNGTSETADDFFRQKTNL